MTWMASACSRGCSIAVLVLWFLTCFVRREIDFGDAVVDGLGRDLMDAPRWYFLVSASSTWPGGDQFGLDAVAIGIMVLVAVILRGAGELSTDNRMQRATARQAGGWVLTLLVAAGAASLAGTTLTYTASSWYSPRHAFLRMVRATVEEYRAAATISSEVRRRPDLLSPGTSAFERAAMLHAGLYGTAGNQNFKQDWYTVLRSLCGQPKAGVADAYGDPTDADIRFLWRELGPANVRRFADLIAGVLVYAYVPGPSNPRTTPRGGSTLDLVRERLDPRLAAVFSDWLTNPSAVPSPVQCAMRADLLRLDIADDYANAAGIRSHDGLLGGLAEAGMSAARGLRFSAEGQ
jgi:hypothetical protein